jgi:hypothetical protein
MNYPVFIFRELTLSLSQIRPDIGDYDSSFVRDNEFMILTTNGRIAIDYETIAKQYQDPKLLSKADLAVLAQSFLYTEKTEPAFS